jgi:hypothetical protein
LRLSDEYRDNREIWIKCPKCGERFRPQSADLSAKLAPGPAPGPSPSGKKAVEDILSRMDLERMQAKQGDEEFTLDAIPVIPEPPPKTKLYAAITILFVLAALVALGIVFNRSGAPAAQPQAAETPAPPEYGEHLLLSDMMSLRKDILKLRHVDRDISYRGRESRIYKYFVTSLAPDLCQDITQIHLWSPRTSLGFKMRGTCLDPTKSVAVLEVDWNFQAAKISVSGRPLVVDLPLPKPF